MNTEDRFDELLDQWEAAREQGRRLSAEELCRNYPELLGRVREQIQALEWIPSQNPVTGFGDFTAPGSVQRGDVLFGRYTLQQNAGRGGYGTVWRAFDRVLERDVALKIPHRFRQSTAARQSVVAEARKLARLKHPRIVRVLDVVEDEHHAVIVTEFVPGTTLADGISERRFTPSQAAELVARIADGLEHAHQQGFVHRDIKPANILLDEHGEPYLTDFGIAVDTERDTDAASGAGTLSYMAPEQARGEPVDARTDVFSLGVVLYELLSGNRPFCGDSPAAVRNAILAADPPSIRTSDDSVPLPLQTVCFRALSRRPEDRFPTARDFADKLRSSVSGQRRQSSAGRALAAGLMLALIGVWYWLSTRPDSPSPSSSLSVNSVADTAAMRTPERQSVEPAIKAPPAVTVLEAESVLRGHRGRISSVSWSADNRWLVSGSWDKSVRLWDAKTATFMGIFKGHTEGIGGVAVSPDGMYAASGGGHNYRDSTVRIWDLQTGKQSTLFDQHQHNVMAVAWAPNGEFLVSGSLDNTIRRWEPDSGQQMRLLGVHRRADVNNWDAQVWAVAVSPDSRTVAAGLRDGTVRLIDADTGKQSTSLTGHTDWVTGVDFSRDGAAIASCSRDGTARLYDVRTGQMLREFTPGLDRLNAVRFTSDGQRIVCAGEASDFVMLDVEHGREVVRFTGHTESVRCLAISNDGTIASGSDDATIRVWPAWSSPGSEPTAGTAAVMMPD